MVTTARTSKSAKSAKPRAANGRQVKQAQALARVVKRRRNLLIELAKH